MNTIKIKEKFKGNRLICTAPADFERNVEKPGVFILDDDLTQQELAYIHAMTGGSCTYETKATKGL